MDIGTAFVMIADKLGVVGEQLVVIYANVQGAYGLLSIATWIVLIISSFMAYLYLKKSYKADCIQEEKEKKERPGYYEDRINPVERTMMKMFILLGVILMLAWATWSIGQSIMHLWYPQYFAIEDLIGTLSNVVD